MPDDPFRSHEVANQPPPLLPRNLYCGDRWLVAGIERFGGSWGEDRLESLGAVVGSPEYEAWAHDANRYPPRLVTHDRFGHRADRVEFHPAWHALLRVAVENGLHALPWRAPEQAEEAAGRQVVRAGLFFLASQGEAGHGCPISMTYSVVPALEAEPELAARWRPGVESLIYDPVFRPPEEKAGLLFGMAMTEKQGGSDVRANTTRAEPTGGGDYSLVGHKWFCSAPMCDAFLTLAQAPGGLTCFLVPRFRPDGSLNAIRLQRLKDKLGNRSNASSEIEYHGAWARRLGAEGRGIPTILKMVQHTRLDCVLGSAALQRRAISEALHHARHRQAFGRLLVEQPLMRRVLVDLALEVEGSVAVMLRLAAAFDRSDDLHEAALARIATAVAKFWVCKRTPRVVAEALECHGGNGYVEESVLPRLFRESPLNSIWEGSGNVICLDVVRALAREPETGVALVEELGRARGLEPTFDRALEGLEGQLRSPEPAEARCLTARLGALLAASQLLAAGSPAASWYCHARLEAPGRAFGDLDGSEVEAEVLERAGMGDA